MSTETSTTEKHHFQAEIQQLLSIVIHSLYTDKEIFVRELVSNASDALEKLRFSQTSGAPILEPDSALKISIATDEKANTLTITDTGIGMSHGELVENLGTIAHSGSKAFLRKLAEEKKPDVNLIGQFGVGFYSAFMVASKVVVETRSANPTAQGWRWISEGSGGYEIEPAGELPRGTKIVLHLAEEQKEFAQDYRLEEIIRKYSKFVTFPIELNGKALNTVQAIWARNKNEIKEEEYEEFYKYVAHDSAKPLYRLHFSADAPLAIQALLYVPGQNFEAVTMSRTESEVNLYCKKVMIQAHAKGLFPDWLRFLKGVVDSEDLPLNISRETMQDSSLMQKLNKVLTTKFLKFLDEQATKDATAYNKFFNEYSRFLKEGVVTDFTHREALGRLLRYESSTLPAGEVTSLSDYVKRMPEGQKEIYYLLGTRREVSEGSPYFEVFRSLKFEVLFLYDPWDEFVMENLREFEGKTMKSAEKSDLKIESPQAEGALNAEESKAVAAWLKETLKDKVEEVRASERLVDSPAVVVDKDQFMTASMRRILKAVKKENEGDIAGSKYDLEINPRHPIIVRLERTRQADPALAGKVAEQLLDNARVAAGLLEDPKSMVKRLNELLEQVMAPRGA